MYNILFYENARGEIPLQDYISSLRQKSNSNKRARVLLYKIKVILQTT